MANIPTVVMLNNFICFLLIPEIVFTLFSLFKYIVSLIQDVVFKLVFVIQNG